MDDIWKSSGQVLEVIWTPSEGHLERIRRELIGATPGGHVDYIWTSSGRHKDAIRITHLDDIWTQVGLHLDVMWTTFEGHVDDMWRTCGDLGGRNLRISGSVSADQVDAIWQLCGLHMGIMWTACGDH